jgi:hypothetical protein
MIPERSHLDFVEPANGDFFCSLLMFRPRNSLAKSCEFLEDRVSSRGSQKAARIFALRQVDEAST